MKFDIRRMQYVWVEVRAQDIEHGCTVYKAINGAEYTLLSEVIVGDTKVLSPDGVKFIHRSGHTYSTIPGDKMLFVRVTPQDVYYAVDEIESLGSDWNK